MAFTCSTLQAQVTVTYLDGHTETFGSKNDKHVEIADGQFQRAKIERVEMGANVKKIGRSAFTGCKKLCHVLMNEGLEEIGYFAFDDCDDLREIKIPASVTTIGSTDTIQTEGGSPLYFSKDYLVFSNCDKLTKIVVAPGNKKYESVDGLLLERNNPLRGGRRLLCCPAGKTGKVVLPQGTTMIQSYAFNGCFHVKEVELPPTLLQIQQCAFQQCGITQLHLPASVEYVQDNPFPYCFNLAKLTVDPNSENYCVKDGGLYSKDMRELVTTVKTDSTTFRMAPTVEQIYKAAFFMSLWTEVTISPKVKELPYWSFATMENLHSLVIPEGVEQIGDEAFANNALERITLPASLQSIGHKVWDVYNSFTIECKGSTPPHIYDNTLDGWEEVTLIVPRGSLSTYKSDPNWGKAAKIVEK